MCVQTTEKAIIRKEKHLEDDGEVEGDDEVIYKIEVAANRSAGFVLVNRIDITGYPEKENPGKSRNMKISSNYTIMHQSNMGNAVSRHIKNQLRICSREAKPHPLVIDFAC